MEKFVDLHTHTNHSDGMDSVEELLKTVIIASANDSMVALAEYVSGDENFEKVNNVSKEDYELLKGDVEWINR